MIPVSTVRLGEAEERRVLEVLRSGRLAQGPMVEELERAFRPIAGVEHVVAVNNGTTALVAALQALGIGPGDEVITSPFTFVATINAILHVGATARFVDITDDFTMDPATLDHAVTERTRVVIPVHLYGLMADMPAIAAVAERRNLLVLEDAAQAHGSAAAGRPAGSWGTGCFSLYATKNLTSGEGGLITTDDSALADRLRVLRNQGMRARYDYEMAGQNYRMTDVHAAIALPQLAAIAERTKQRRRNAARLTEGLADVPGLSTPVVPEGRTHVWHQYTVRVRAEARLDRDGLAKRLENAGVGTGVYYPRTVLGYQCFREHPRVESRDVPAADAAAREVLSLPVHPWLTDADLDQIIGATREALGA
jgi:dTDP-4-amino-4,6-dideoxygalactose transaminase